MLFNLFRGGLFVVLATMGLFVRAEVRLPRILSDGLVVQRDKPIPVWGWATSEKTIAVQFAGMPDVKVDVKDGKWLVNLPKQAAGGPFTITVKGSNTLVIKDVLVGELWVASGQSNMELPMYRVAERFPEEFQQKQYPMVREFKVPKEYDYQKPRDDLSGGDWTTVNAETLGQFSAVAYYYAKELHKTLNVPIGIVLTAYGGATAEGWMSADALQKYPHYLNYANQLANAEYLKKMQDEDKKDNDAWYGNLDKNDAGLIGVKKWFDPTYDTSSWASYKVPGYWEDAGLKDIDGVVWFQKQFSLPKNVLGKPAKLKLGRIVDADTVYVNGVQVGGITYQYPPRRYDVPAELLKTENLITVRIVNNGGKGGFVKDNPYELIVGDYVVPLAGEWRHKLGVASKPSPANRHSQFTSPLGFYNAMLAPLLNLNIKGVVWYQGESNTGKGDEYRQLFPDMIRNWRSKWGIGNFPFIFVQLANFMEAQEQPIESGWALTREAQRLALSEPNTAMVTAIDLGEWNDIHPLNKQAVGYRLSLAARQLAYHEKNLEISGPTPKKVKIKRDTIYIDYDHVGQKLVVHGDELKGFSVAGADGKYVWAQAKLDKKRVIVKSKDVQQPVSVRYAWADNPDTANLYNSVELPAVPFEWKLDSKN